MRRRAGNPAHVKHGPRYPRWCTVRPCVAFRWVSHPERSAITAPNPPTEIGSSLSVSSTIGTLLPELVRAGNACDWQKFSGGHYQRVAGGKACTRN